MTDITQTWVARRPTRPKIWLMGTQDQTVSVLVFIPSRTPTANAVSLVVNTMVPPITCDLGQFLVSRVVNFKGGDHFDQSRIAPVAPTCLVFTPYLELCRRAVCGFTPRIREMDGTKDGMKNR